MPNPADASVPDGGEDDGEVVQVVGGTPAPPPLDHAAFAEAMGFVDTPRAAEASGSRFAYIMREARAARARARQLRDERDRASTASCR